MQKNNNDCVEDREQVDNNTEMTTNGREKVNDG